MFFVTHKLVEMFVGRNGVVCSMWHAAQAICCFQPRAGARLVAADIAPKCM
jgi:hypothetical protein